MNEVAGKAMVMGVAAASEVNKVLFYYYID